MKRNGWVWLVAIMSVIVVLAGAVPLDAAVSGAAPVKGQLPLLITNAGQGPGAKMARLLLLVIDTNEFVMQTCLA